MEQISKEYVNEKICCFDEIRDKSCYIEDFIKELQEIEEENKDKFEYILINADAEPIYDEYGNYRYCELKDYIVVGTRKETDEEYQKRIEPIEERNKRIAMRLEEERIKKEEEDFQLYLKLKERFKGKENE